MNKNDDLQDKDQDLQSGDIKTENLKQVDENVQQCQNGKFFNLSDVKELNLKQVWLGSTYQALKQYDEKYDKFTAQKTNMLRSLKIFQENERNYKLSSLRKMDLTIDKKAMYRQYMKKSRKLIQKLHVSIILNICSYADENIFYGLTRMRRVSKIFNFLYNSSQVCQLIAYRDLGIEEEDSKDIDWCQKQLKNYCKRYIKFISTMKSYKQMFYTSDLPQNSIIQDISQAVSFINQIHSLVYLRKSKQLGYFQMINKLMKRDRVVIGLAALSLTSLVITRKASIVAFSNYLALNPKERRKQQITKTQYLKVINVAEDEVYKDSLLMNTKVSAYLQTNYQLQIGIFISQFCHDLIEKLQNYSYWDILLFHQYDETRSRLFRNISTSNEQAPLMQFPQFPLRVDLGDAELYFKKSFMCVQLSIMSHNNEQVQLISMEGSPQIVIKNEQQFGYCYLYHGQQYYVLLIGKSVEELCL